ncbi:MAG TPA: hydantoinase/carbamoylase family amidase [Conexibacter sp.]|nr:hydantoinase/carbamoylase family amidase [Conexibacter sp.]
MRVDATRLWASVDRSAEFGRIAGGGLSRLALSDADGAMREQLVAWCREAQLDVRVDAVGNVFARRTGAEPALAPVAIGSHLDTQVHAGRYDGVLGVLAGLEVLRTLDAHGVRTRRPLELVCWTDEEGARFNTGMLGASAFTGRLGLADALARADADGVTVAAALARIGFPGEAPVPGHALHAYLELHIEQGSILDASGVDVGVVERAYPVYHLAVAFHGETGHGGPPPMDARRNALVGAARAIAALDSIGRRHAPEARTNTSAIACWPNRAGIVPAEVTVRMDLRHPDGGALEQLRDEAVAAFAIEAAAVGVRAEVVSCTRSGGQRFDDDCVEALEAAARERGHATVRMATIAAHDATVIADAFATAMVFCPCRGGVTHNPAEEVDRERVLPAVEVLMDAAVRLAEPLP